MYKPFGQAQVHPNSLVENHFRLPGQYYDEETGLHYNYHRYYDPRTGRYLTPDPLNLWHFQVTRKAAMNHPLQSFGSASNASELQNPLALNPFFRYTSNGPQLLNSYLYTSNNPVNSTDPPGLWISLRISTKAWEFIAIGVALTEAGATLAGAGIVAVPVAGPYALIPITVGISQMGVGFYSFWEGASKIVVIIDYDAINDFIDRLRQPFEDIDIPELCEDAD